MWLTVASSKGGCGKTTTSVTIAHALASAGKPTLLVDLDPLGQAALALGKPPANEVYRLLVEKRTVAELVQPARPHLDLLAGDSETKICEAFLHLQGAQLAAVGDRLRQACSAYTNVVCDTSPSGLLQEVALYLADVNVVPVTPDYFGVQGLMGVMGLRESGVTHADQAIIVLPTMFQSRLNRHRDILEQLGEYCANQPNARLADPIPLRDEVREMMGLGVTLLEHSPRSGHGEAFEAVKTAYNSLFDLILEVGQNGKEEEKHARTDGG